MGFLFQVQAVVKAQTVIKMTDKELDEARRAVLNQTAFHPGQQEIWLATAIDCIKYRILPKDTAVTPQHKMLVEAIKDGNIRAAVKILRGVGVPGGRSVLSSFLEVASTHELRQGQGRQNTAGKNQFLQ